MDPAIKRHASRIIRQALDEDIGYGDLTTQAVFPQPFRAEAVVVAKENLVLAGIEIAAMVFRSLDPEIQFEMQAEDGASIKTNAILARLRGDGRAILTGERVAINFMQRLSGIATRTAQYVKAVKGFKARIVDTRKTTPGWRILEKYAVRAGGGRNHRFALDHGILIKDNHVDLAGNLTEAIRRARDSCPHPLKIEVEARNFREVKDAISGEADIILLDNMAIPEMKKAVDWIKGRALIEASGGITLSRIAEIAATGVDYISVGSLTHSAPAVDICLDIKKNRRTPPHE